MSYAENEFAVIANRLGYNLNGRIYTNKETKSIIFIETISRERPQLPQRRMPIDHAFLGLQSQCRCFMFGFLPNFNFVVSLERVSVKDYLFNSLPRVDIVSQIFEVQKFNTNSTENFFQYDSPFDGIQKISFIRYKDNNGTLYLDELKKYIGSFDSRNIKLSASSLEVPNKRSDQSLQQIFYGAPGTGKSNTIKREVEDKGRALFRTTFHPDSDYSTFVGCYKPTMVEAPVRDGSGHEVANAKPEEKNRISYSFVPQAFTKAYCEAWNRLEANEPVFLIVEEINRGNCAQIFGDIFQLLDREMEGARCGFSTYPIDADEDLKAFLETGAKKDGTQWLTNKEGIKDGKLCLPPNLYIWATMNTSDQSLFPIDSAFKRRWDWEYVPIKRADKEPENKWIIKVTHDGKTYWCYWWEFLEAINHQIEETTHSEDKQLGYFFAKPKAGEDFISTDTFVNKVIFYLWNDVFKDEDSAVFQYDNNKVEDVSVNHSGTMYFRHFMENKDEMIHYFINQLFAMGKDNNPVVPIDYLKNDADSKVIEHLPKMRVLEEEAPASEEIPNENADDDDGKAQRNTDKYIVDGAEEQIKKKQLFEKIVRKQIEKNPSITIEELKDSWKDLSLNSQPCILADDEYQKLISEKPSYQDRYYQIEGKEIWVNNQIGGADTASIIIEKAKSQGISVEIVKK